MEDDSSLSSLTTAQSQVPLYETLTSIALSSPSSSPTAAAAAASPVLSLELDILQPSYTVFRREISLAAGDSPAAAESTAPDYFSLDVGDNEECEPSMPVPEERRVEAERNAEALAAPEPRLESGWFRGNYRFKSPMMQLHKEILDFCDFLSPTPEEEAARRTAVNSVVNVIKYIWPNCKVEIFGSFRTGLYLPSSDIDAVILRSGVRNAQNGLHALSRALSQKCIAKKIQVIAKARVPIVKFVEKKSGVSFDVSFDVDGGPKAAEFIKDAVFKWPALRPLCLILKVFLQQRELNEVYTGGISSYALLTMLMGVLKSLRECQASTEHNLGVLLVHFFEFYGRKLNTADVGVSCNGKGVFFSKHKKGFMNKGQRILISIEDPQAPGNDIGKNSFNYFQVRSAFGMAFSTLTNPKIILSLGPNRSILGTIIRPDPILVERKGGCNGEVTFKSLLPGAGEPLVSQNGHNGEILCNWQLDDEEAYPRGGRLIGDGSTESSGKKRRASSKESSAKKKLKENGVRSRRSGISEMAQVKGSKKTCSRHSQDDANGFTRFIAGLD